jgi:hypothetical protein
MCDFQTGAAMLDGGLLKYYGVTIPLPLILIAAVEVGLMGAVETYRSKNSGPAGEVRGELYTVCVSCCLRLCQAYAYIFAARLSCFIPTLMLTSQRPDVLGPRSG